MQLKSWRVRQVWHVHGLFLSWQNVVTVCLLVALLFSVWDDDSIEDILGYKKRFSLVSLWDIGNLFFQLSTTYSLFHHQLLLLIESSFIPTSPLSLSLPPYFLSLLSPPNLAHLQLSPVLIAAHIVPNGKSSKDLIFCSAVYKETAQELMPWWNSFSTFCKAIGEQQTA